MKIYKVGTAHSRWGSNWGSYNVAARTAEEAIRKAKKQFVSGERVDTVQLLATADY